MIRGPTLFYWIAIFSATICGTAHLATFAGQAFYPVIYFVILLFIVWPMVILRWRWLGRAMKSPTLYMGYSRTLIGMALGCIAYIFANYLICKVLNDGGNPVRLDDGRFVIQVGNKIVRNLTAEGYSHAQAVQVRMLSGHLFGFYALAAIALRVCNRAEQAAIKAEEAAIKGG